MERGLKSKKRKIAILAVTVLTFFLLTACNATDAKEIFAFPSNESVDGITETIFDENIELESKEESNVDLKTEVVSKSELSDETGKTSMSDEIRIPKDDISLDGTPSEEVLEDPKIELGDVITETELAKEGNENFVNYEGNCEGEKRVIDEDGKMVALTFDDGPSAKYTQVILDILKEHNALATFFEIGYLAEDYPEIVLAEYEAGHEIGNHSFTHLNMKTSSYEKVMSEINKTNDMLEAITGVRPIYIRPPYGNLNKAALSDAGMHVILWSVDTRDWESKSEEKIMEVIKEKKNLDGHVILMHSTQKATANVLDELLLYLEENGYQCVTISELFKYKYGMTPEYGKTYGYTFFHSAQSKE